jgi:hypothetical protein
MFKAVYTESESQNLYALTKRGCTGRILIERALEKSCRIALPAVYSPALWR